MKRSVSKQILLLYLLPYYLKVPVRPNAMTMLMLFQSHLCRFISLLPFFFLFNKAPDSLIATTHIINNSSIHQSSIAIITAYHSKILHLIPSWNSCKRVNNMQFLKTSSIIAALALCLSAANAFSVNNVNKVALGIKYIKSFI